MPRITGIPKVNFNLDVKTVKSEKADKGYIVLFYRYKYRGKTVRVKYFTSEYVQPKYWDKKSQRAKFTRNHPEYVDLNAKLNDLENIAIQIYKDNDLGNISPEDFKKEIAYRIGDKVRPEDDKSLLPSFSDFVERFIEDQKKKAPSNTWKKYLTAYNHLVTFTEVNQIELEYETIDWSFREKFIEYLYAPPRQHSRNSVAKSIAMLRKFLKESYRAGYHKNEIFKDGSFGVREVKTKNKVKLSLDELDGMLALDLSQNERLERVRDLFIVGAFSGQRFGDWHKITKDQIFTDEGTEMIRIMAEKTRKYTPIPLLHELKQILEKYDYQLPKISSQRFNDYIKEVAQLALGDTPFMRIYSEGDQLKTETVKKWEAITSHAARRSFVSNFLQLGIPPILIRAITGHATEKQLYEYADIEADELAASFGRQADIALKERKEQMKRTKEE